MAVIVVKTKSIDSTGLLNLTIDDIITDNFHAYEESEITIISLDPSDGIAYKLSNKNATKFFPVGN